MSRGDGRGNQDLRELSLWYEGLRRVDSSARFGFGDITALASISGPIEVRLSAEQSSQATFELFVRPLSNVPATEAKSLASSIRSLLVPSLILTQNPRSLLQVVIQSLTQQRKGLRCDALTAAMINASSLAFLSAVTVPLKGVVCAVAVCRLRTASGPMLVVDPSEIEEEALEAGGCFAFLFGAGDVGCVGANWRCWFGQSDEKELSAARDLALIAAKQVYNTMKISVDKKIKGAGTRSTYDGKINTSDDFTENEADDLMET